MRLKSIEGPSFAGKSTLARHVSKQYDGQFVGEYMDYAYTGGRNGSPSTPQTVDEAKRGVDFFLDIERERTRDIRKGLAESRLVISDRTVLSLVAYQVALDKRRRHLPGIQIAVPDYTIDRVRQSIELGDIEMSEHLIVLRAANEQVHNARVERRGNTTMGVFNHWHFSNALYDATTQAAHELLPDSARIKLLLSEDGDEAFARNVQDSSQFFELGN